MIYTLLSLDHTIFQRNGGTVSLWERTTSPQSYACGQAFSAIWYCYCFHIVQATVFKRNHFSFVSVALLDDTMIYWVSVYSVPSMLLDIGIRTETQSPLESDVEHSSPTSWRSLCQRHSQTDRSHTRDKYSCQEASEKLAWSIDEGCVPEAVEHQARSEYSSRIQGRSSVWAS